MSDPHSSPSSGSGDDFIGLLRVISLPLAACLVFFLITPGGVQSLHHSTAEVRQQVVGVVQSQFAAFREGDYARAYSLAAAGLQKQLTVTSFERMVKDGYPIIAYWRAISFGDVVDNRREAEVIVTVQGRSGRTRFFRYMLVREDNEWRISGVAEINLSPAVQGQAA